MKKKRSIQKLKVHKETISNLNAITGGDLTTSVIRGIKIIQSAAGILTCECPPHSLDISCQYTGVCCAEI